MLMRFPACEEAFNCAEEARVFFLSLPWLESYLHKEETFDLFL
jgi:hypothetical protein